MLVTWEKRKISMVKELQKMKESKDRLRQKISYSDMLKNNNRGSGTETISRLGRWEHDGRRYKKFEKNILTA